MISRHGIPFVGASGVLLAAAALAGLDWEGWGRYPLVLSGALLLALMLNFFRDPERVPPPGEDLVLAPADGRVIQVSDVKGEPYPAGKWTLVAIFMSIWNVHVNRAPISGRVVKRTRSKGRFFPAFREEASRRNESCSLLIEHGARTVLMRQITGVIARRIITYPGEGDLIARGQRVGMILFGSRVELLLPPECDVRIRNGERTVAGRTIVGSF